MPKDGECAVHRCTWGDEQQTMFKEREMSVVSKEGIERSEECFLAAEHFSANLTRCFIILVLQVSIPNLAATKGFSPALMILIKAWHDQGKKGNIYITSSHHCIKRNLQEPPLIVLVL